jgi:hypothetical protein
MIIFRLSGGGLWGGLWGNPLLSHVESPLYTIQKSPVYEGISKVLVVVETHQVMVKNPLVRWGFVSRKPFSLVL